MDRDIHRNYEIYPCNYIAYDLLNESQQGRTLHGRRDESLRSLSGQTHRMIDLSGKDIPFLRERLLTMYANPLKNHLLVSEEA